MLQLVNETALKKIQNWMGELMRHKAVRGWGPGVSEELKDTKLYIRFNTNIAMFLPSPQF